MGMEGSNWSGEPKPGHSSGDAHGNEERAAKALEVGAANLPRKTMELERNGWLLGRVQELWNLPQAW